MGFEANTSLPGKSMWHELEFAGKPGGGAEVDDGEFRWRLKTVYRKALTTSGLNSLLQLPALSEKEQRILEGFLDESVRIVAFSKEVSGLRWQRFELEAGAQRVEAEFDTRLAGLQHTDPHKDLVFELDRLRREACCALNRLALCGGHTENTVGLKKLRWPEAGSSEDACSKRTPSLASVLKGELANGQLGRLTLSVDESDPNSLNEIADAVRQISVSELQSPENTPQFELICSDEALRERLLDGCVVRHNGDEQTETSIQGLHPVRIALDVRDNDLGISKAHLWLTQEAMTQINRWFHSIEDMGLISISAECPWVVWDIPNQVVQQRVTSVWNEIRLFGWGVVGVTGLFELQGIADYCSNSEGSSEPAPKSFTIEAETEWQIE